MNHHQIFFIATHILLANFNFASETTVYKCDSLMCESSKTAISIRGYTQKGEWKDTHDLIIDYSSIVSMNGFRDEKNPKVSITTKEIIIDTGLAENRIYWISFKSIADLNGFVDFAWKGKMDNPVFQKTTGVKDLKKITFAQQSDAPEQAIMVYSAWQHHIGRPGDLWSRLIIKRKDKQ